MTDSINQFIKNLNDKYKTGITTEHSYRSALETFVESLHKGIKATNEPTREKCGAPDFIVQRKNVPVGYIECKDITWSLDTVEKTDQLKRYLSSLNNLILTNYLEFRYYVKGDRVMTVPIARIDSKGKIKKIPGCENNLLPLFDSFFAFRGPSISTPKDLAERMAKLAQLIRDTINKAFELESKKGKLHTQFDAFRKVLLSNLTKEQFADMYAQTICYGLFAARCSVNGIDADNFTRQHAAYQLPKTNPFLREVFGQIAGPDLDDNITWVVDDLAELLRKADIASILADFGKATRQEDPVVHFYETFLSQYDPKMRESRGVYYTPEPVVSYIVRSVDHILKTDFGLKGGLADSTMIKHQFENPETLEKEERTVHKVQILDPAAGTGTFLYGVINQIYDSFIDNKGLWSSYVSKHLLPRLYGFELLMAPYAVAHMKLGLQLQETGYDFQSDERLRVYLTNALEEAHDYVEEAFASLIAEEANRASEVKKDVPVMVVLGNPPYSGHSANKGKWIHSLLRGIDNTTGEKTENYFEVEGESIGERNPKWLNNDYVKFIRFSQHRISQTGHGIHAFITSHSFLDSPTFRGMRESLLNGFDLLYIIDLHGNYKKKEKSPDGSKDENVFDITEGVAISIFVKLPKKKRKKKIFHVDVYGSRDYKFEWLLKNDIKSTKWTVLTPSSKCFYFSPYEELLESEYSAGWQITDSMPVNSVGIVSARDEFTIQWSEDEIWKTVNKFIRMQPEDARQTFSLGEDTIDWKVKQAQDDLNRNKLSKNSVVKILYRLFDERSTYYTGKSNGFICRPRPDVMRHMLRRDNIALITTRQQSQKGIDWSLIGVSKTIIDACAISNKTKEINYLFPLYLYPDPDDNGDLFSNGLPRHINFNDAFIEELCKKLKLEFADVSDSKSKKYLTPTDIFHYIYAILHSPTYRRRYAEFLKIDFPRIPLTADIELFRRLCALGEELVGLHLMEKVPAPFTNYPVKGDDIVDKPVYVAPQEGKDSHDGRVYINKSQYFENIPPEVWEFHIGGYQVCHKWLKDRKGRKLTYEDVNHYRNMVVVLSETRRIMDEIDNAIPQWPIV